MRHRENGTEMVGYAARARNPPSQARTRMRSGLDSPSPHPSAPSPTFAAGFRSLFSLACLVAVQLSLAASALKTVSKYYSLRRGLVSRDANMSEAVGDFGVIGLAVSRSSVEQTGWKAEVHACITGHGAELHSQHVSCRCSLGVHHRQYLQEIAPIMASQ